VNQFGWSQIGLRIACAGCAKSMTVPVPMETVGPAVPRPRAFIFRCPKCRRKFSTKPELAGKKIRCNGCGAGVRVPHDDEEPVVPASRTAAPSVYGSDRATAPASTTGRSGALVDSGVAAEDEATDPEPDDDDFGWIKKARRRRRARAVLPSRAEVMEQVRQQAAEEEVVTTAKKARNAKARKKKPKRSSYFDAKETLKLVAGVGGLVAVLAFLAWGYPEFRFPLGAFLGVIGFIVYLLGSASLRQVVAEEGVLKLLLFRFCPPYQWWYVMTHWTETRDFFAFFAAGAVIMSLAGGIIKTSAEGKKAEASDRAYRKMQRDRQAIPPPAISIRRERDGD
jgi:hypothetical protein